MAQVDLRDLAAPGGVALLLVFLFLPGIFWFGSRRWVGRLLALAVVLAIPWWAEHAESGATRFTAGEWALDYTYDRLRNRLPEEARGHAVIQRTRAPSTRGPGTTIAWTPERSASAELLRTLGLMTAPAALPLRDFDAVADTMRARAASALGAMTSQQLAAFAENYEAMEYRTRLRTLHRVVVVRSLCTVIAEPTLDQGLRRRLEHVRTGGLEGEVEACGGERAAA